MVTTVKLNVNEYDNVLFQTIFNAVAHETKQHTSMDSTTKYWFRDGSSTFIYRNLWAEKTVVSVYDKLGFTVCRMEYYPSRIN